MTIDEVITALGRMDPAERKKELFVQGYEDGLCDVVHLTACWVKKNALSTNYSGPHDYSPTKPNSIDEPGYWEPAYFITRYTDREKPPRNIG